MGDIGTTSFFPSKPLACYGDGGALITSNPQLAERARQIANHGQQVKYHHQLIGCNSRLDTLQAAILQVKLRHLDQFNQARQAVAQRYDAALGSCPGITIPAKCNDSSHVYHQYTVQVSGDRRSRLQHYLKERGIPSMIYYPLPLHQQEAFQHLARTPYPTGQATRLSQTVLSLPIHTEMTEEEIDFIIDSILHYEQ